MKKITKRLLTVLLALCSVHGAFSQIQFKSGLTLSGGESKFYDMNNIVAIGGLKDRKVDAAIGYKLRLQPALKPFFIDLDVQAGYVQGNYSCPNEEYDPDNALSTWPWKEVKDNCFRLSVNPTFNCRVYDGWYAGLGVEPVYYLVSKSESQGGFSKFDISPTVRVGYDFKYMDLSFNYKYGLCDVMDTDYFSSGKIRRWQLQLFIPF